MIRYDIIEVAPWRGIREVSYEETVQAEVAKKSLHMQQALKRAEISPCSFLLVSFRRFSRILRT